MKEFVRTIKDYPIKGIQFRDITTLLQRADSFQERRDFVVKSLNDIDGINCLNQDGAFYVFPSSKGLIGKKDPNG